VTDFGLMNDAQHKAMLSKKYRHCFLIRNWCYISCFMLNL